MSAFIFAAPLLLWGCAPHNLRGWENVWFPFGGGGLFLLSVLVILIIVLSRRDVKHSQDGDATPGDAEQETPMEILKKRYARGEINREEFEVMKKDLQD